MVGVTGSSPVASTILLRPTHTETVVEGYAGINFRKAECPCEAYTIAYVVKGEAGQNKTPGEWWNGIHDGLIPPKPDFLLGMCGTPHINRKESSIGGEKSEYIQRMYEKPAKI